jgi:uncharacterized protein YlbG (UPF0298 family)
MNNMKLQSTLPWITRVLAIVGLVAITIFLWKAFTNRDNTLTSAVGVWGEAPMMYEAQLVMEDSFKSTTPERGGLLYDEAIAADVDQKIIKTGSLDLLVDRADESLEGVEMVASQNGGYVETSTVQEHEDGTKSGYVTIRVPAEAFDDSMQALKQLAVVVERETSSAQDVTEQYRDLAARLKNARAQEERYVDILNVANTVEEILQIEIALGNIRGTIESLQGQIQYLDNLTGFSTITISLSEEPIIMVGGKEFRPGASVKEAVQAVVGMVQALVVAVIWIVIVGVGIGAPLVLIGWLGWIGIVRIKLWRK